MHHLSYLVRRLIALARLALSAQSRRVASVIRRSEYFDAAWYRRTYASRPGVRWLGPALHYAWIGFRAGLHPSLRFSTTAYLALHSDVLAADINPLWHYEVHGRTERRTFGPVGPLAHSLSVVPSPSLKMVYISGEPDTPGHRYRVEFFVTAAAAAGIDARWTVMDHAEAQMESILGADVVVLWRVAWSDTLSRLVVRIRQREILLVFDVDDLVFDPSFATIEYVDAIRACGYSEAATAELFHLVRRAVLECDAATGSTRELQLRLGRLPKPAYLLPNGFDETTLAVSRLAVRRRASSTGDGLMRLGYAAGSRTHQRDFGEIAASLATILDEFPESRLVLFRRGIPIVELAEFPVLQRFESRVEWRDWVPHSQLPDEIARYEINLAPLQLGNPVCEAKSELKYFEAALVDVPTVASPTEPFRRAIRHGENGFLAATPAEWTAALRALIADESLRRRIGRAAHLDALVAYGPERRADAMRSWLQQLRGDTAESARAFELDFLRSLRGTSHPPQIATHDVLWRYDALGSAEVSVVIPLFNYGRFIEETLSSVAAQSLRALDVVVVDDASSDDSRERAIRWLGANRRRFNRALLVANETNSGLSLTRNVGFANAETPFVQALDADDLLLPDCCRSLLDVIKAKSAAFVYPILRTFGEPRPTYVSCRPYHPLFLTSGNYIDELSLVRRSAWAAVGGFRPTPYGWEDFDLWCRMAERGFFGSWVERELALYRRHESSMLRMMTDAAAAKAALIDDMERRHPWLSIEDRGAGAS